MGDRGVVVVKSATGYAPGVYVHWHGEVLLDMLKAAIPAMRKGDEGYSAGRLAGELHKAIEGNRDLGLLPCPTAAQIEDEYDKYSHGDAGVIEYDCETGIARLYAGYLRDKHGEQLKLAVPPE